MIFYGSLSVLLFPFYFILCCCPKLLCNCTYGRVYMYTDVIAVTALPSISYMSPLHVQRIILEPECQGEYSYQSVYCPAARIYNALYKSVNEKNSKTTARK
jgi:hypothetical protein